MEQAETKKFGEIPLKNKKKEIVGWAKCSLQHFEELKKFKWYKNNGYVLAMVNFVLVKMHRYIVTVLEKQLIPENYVIDHKNNDRLDNQLNNLRIASFTQNSVNRKKSENTSSQFKGVYKIGNVFQVKGSINGESVYIGSSKIEKNAAIMYDKWCVHASDFYEGFRSLNFPENLEYYKLNSNVIKSKTSAYFGVSYSKDMFRARIFVNGESTNIKSSTNEIECAKAYDEYVYLNNLNKKLNFPLNYPDYLNNYVPVIKTLIIRNVDNDTIEIKVKNNKTDSPILIDKTDYDIIKTHSIHISNGYLRINKGFHTKLLHRILTNTRDPKIIVDHIDGNTFNCKQSNLRQVSVLENGRNKKKRKTATSTYHGVFKSGSKIKPFRVSVKIPLQTFSSNFADEIEAARWRDLIILKHLANSTYKMNYVWNEQDIQEWKIKFNL